MKTKRSIRRYHRERMKKRALWVIKFHQHGIATGSSEEDQDWAKVAASKRADNIKSCSCWMCGNPRKINKELTLQERKQDIKDKAIEPIGWVHTGDRYKYVE